MTWLDALCLLLATIAAYALGRGALCLAERADISALYWLACGVASIRSAARLAPTTRS